MRDATARASDIPGRKTEVRRKERGERGDEESIKIKERGWKTEWKQIDGGMGERQHKRWLIAYRGLGRYCE